MTSQMTSYIFLYRVYSGIPTRLTNSLNRGSSRTKSQVLLTFKSSILVTLFIRFVQIFDRLIFVFAPRICNGIIHRLNISVGVFRLFGIQFFEAYFLTYSLEAVPPAFFVGLL